MALFPTCLGEALNPAAVRDAERLLSAAGVACRRPSGATCCGQPAWNSGFVGDARRVARRTLRAVADADAVVVPAGSCAAMMRLHWRHLFHGEPEQELAVGVERRLGGRLADRHLLGDAIDRAGRGEDDRRNPRLAHGGEQGKRAADVIPIVSFGVHHRFANIGKSREVHYRRYLMRAQGFGEADWEAPASDRLVDAMVAWGDADALQGRIGELVAAGADHVAVIPVSPEGGTEHMEVLEALAQG